MPVPVDQALAAHAAGLCVLPPREDGSKAPIGEWKQYEERRPTEDEIRRWYNGTRHGLGFVCGRISGGLELFEFEGRAVEAGLHAQFSEACEAAGLGELVDRIAEGYLEMTPSGGVHLLYRCTHTQTEKLARRPGPPAGDRPTIEVLIETKGEGGYVIVAPTGGPVHPNGLDWELVSGGYDRIATITPEERAALHGVARSFDDMPRPAAPEHSPRNASSLFDSDESDKPGDDYNRRARWTDVLEPHGWRRVFQRGRCTHWCRPGKEAGTSATTGHGEGDYLYVFSSSTPFDPDHGYSKFAAYAILNHDGDYSAAARALVTDGYGEQRQPVAKTTPPPGDEDYGIPVANEEQVAVWEPPAGGDAPPADSPRPDASTLKPDRDIDTFLDSDDPEYDWLVPGLLERGDRLIVTGPEGGGKSTLLRQFAIQLSAGIHPFTLDEIEPINVLLLDLENSERQTRRKIRPLRIQAGARLDPQRLRVRIVSQGINLASELHQDWLDTRLAANKPDVIITGPLYKLADGDPTEEKVAKPVAVFLDHMRAKHGVAVIIEAHSPHAATAGGKRPERPYGWSGWLRWPEFGIHLSEKGVVSHWRGQRDEREWPSLLERGGMWMWTAVTDPNAARFADMLSHCRSIGAIESNRAIGKALGISEATVRRAIENNRNEWDSLRRELDAE